MREDPTPNPTVAYLESVRSDVLDEIHRIVPGEGRFRPILYDLVHDYPLRPAKGLRPALAVATCRALGGRRVSILPTAAVIELYHNAFLIHDDVEDGSWMRRDAPTLHEAWGVPIAVNVGDAMLALTLRPLLDNMALLGMSRALRILREIGDMATVTAEGQALELHWIRSGTVALSDEDYLDMVDRKTSRYSFATPMVVGAMAARADDRVQDACRTLARPLGAAFQITDDLLNLLGDPADVGKELAGDLWEGKRTLILLHALREATDAERERARDVLSRPRPRPEPDPSWIAALAERLGRPQEEVRLAHIGASTPGEVKTAEDVAFLEDLIRRTGAVAHAQRVARRCATDAGHAFAALDAELVEGEDRAFLSALVAYVVERTR